MKASETNSINEETDSVKEMEEYVRDRITQLRIKKGISEYRLSYDLGHSRGYINNISSGKALPSMTEFLSLCDYFEITPKSFFDTNHPNPVLIAKLIDELKSVSEEDALLLLTIVRRIKSEKDS